MYEPCCATLPHVRHGGIDRADYTCARRAPMTVALLACTAVLAACTSGSGGGDIDPGSGQSPDPATVDFPIAYVKRPNPEDPPMRAAAHLPRRR